MFETVMNQSIQRWEYEGGRIPSAESDRSTGHHRGIGLEAPTKAGVVRSPAALERRPKRHSAEAESTVSPKRSIGATPRVRSILVPMDFTAGAITAFEYACLPEHEIARLADCLNARMIMLGRNPRSFLGRLLFGSVTQAIN